jgi:acetyl-CoA carboxylase biotin carboxyl carrier protein
MKELGPHPVGASPANTADTELIEALAKIIARHGLSEIEIARGDLKVRVARQISASLVQPLAPAHAAPAPAGKPAGVAASGEAPGTVKSPMVGTAYLRSSPNAPPFVEIGAQVKAGDKILLVEAMKTFNEIVAPRAGTVTGILVEDGQPVEYGQPLLIIE